MSKLEDKLGERLEDMLKGTAALAYAGIITILGRWGYQRLYDMIAKGNNNDTAFCALYTTGICLLAAAPAIAFIYNKYKNYRANQKV